MQTIFSKSSIPSNLLLGSEWRKFANSMGVNIWTAQRKFAQAKGGSLFLRADGSLIVHTRLASGKIRRSTYKEGSWAWEAA